MGKHDVNSKPQEVGSGLSATIPDMSLVRRRRGRPMKEIPNGQCSAALSNDSLVENIPSSMIMSYQTRSNTNTSEVNTALIPQRRGRPPLTDISNSNHCSAPYLSDSLLENTPSSAIMSNQTTANTNNPVLVTDLFPRRRGRQPLTDSSNGGRTAHSRFGIPINVNEDSFCSITAGTDLAALLIKTSLIIWDEAPMMHRHFFEALDRSLRDIIGSTNPKAKEMPFGGKVIVFGGDFRQILPVIPGGTRQDVVHASLNSSYIWDDCTVLELTTNMRLREGGPNDGEATVDIPDDILISDNRAILAPTHEVVGVINDCLLSQILGEEVVYYSSDSICESEGVDKTYTESLCSPEVLNGLKLSGIPNHKLALKVGVPIMLIQNIDQTAGLCNGTRLRILKLGELVNEAQIMTGTNVGHTTIIPRLKLSPSDKRLPLKINRRQFPLAVCFAMTINKSQGQSLSNVGIFLPNPVFTHGQLYVAVSRVKSRKGLKVLIYDKESKPSNNTLNVVYHEVNISGPSGELYGTPTLLDGRDTTKTVETTSTGLTNPSPEFSGQESCSMFSFNSEFFRMFWLTSIYFKGRYVKNWSWKSKCLGWIIIGLTPEGVPFMNNMGIEEPEYGIFFTNVFGNQAFQRWNDIHKGMKTRGDVSVGDGRKTSPNLDQNTSRPLIGIRLNNGKSTSVWLIDGQMWFPSMAQLHVPLLLDDTDDVILWRDRDGVLRSLMLKFPLHFGWKECEDCQEEELRLWIKLFRLIYLWCVEVGPSFKFKKCLPGLVCYLTNGRFQAIVFLMIGVPGEGCTLFSLSKIFPTRFSLERFLRSRRTLDRFAPLCTAFARCSLDFYVLILVHV
ncbi:ATP-dependent DNA helicase PIF1-like protein [Tanacetum coccineum]